MPKKISNIFILLLTLHSITTFASVRYFIQSGSDPNRPRYDSAYLACDAYRQLIQASHDSAGNLGGQATITTLPSETVYPNLKNVTGCGVTWTRNTSVLNMV